MTPGELGAHVSEQCEEIARVEREKVRNELHDYYAREIKTSEDSSWWLGFSAGILVAALIIDAVSAGVYLFLHASR